MHLLWRKSWTRSVSTPLVLSFIFLRENEMWLFLRAPSEQGLHFLVQDWGYLRGREKRILSVLKIRRINLHKNWSRLLKIEKILLCFTAFSDNTRPAMSKTSLAWILGFSEMSIKIWRLGAYFFHAFFCQLGGFVLWCSFVWWTFYILALKLFHLLTET